MTDTIYPTGGSGGQPVAAAIELLEDQICPWGSIYMRLGDEYIEAIQTLIAALRQPTQSDALQADALDFGNELIFACAGLRHEPIDTEAIFSITWDGFPYDVTISAAKGQSK